MAPDQYALAPVTITVKRKSLHPPRFQKTRYEAVVTGVGVMAMDANNKDEPLQIIATDDDYAATGVEHLHFYTVYTPVWRGLFDTHFTNLRANTQIDTQG